VQDGQNLVDAIEDPSEPGGAKSRQVVQPIANARVTSICGVCSVPRHGMWHVGGSTKGEDVTVSNSPSLAPVRPEMPTGWSGLFFKQRRYRRSLRIYADSVLIAKTIDALEAQDPEAFVIPEAWPIGKPPKPSTDASFEDTLTPHEKFLDKWRIATTFCLILFFFAVIVYVVRFTTKDNAASVTPYVSLMSGLAGIALGWMFANSGTGARKGDSATTRTGRGRTRQAAPTTDS
jgi:hypothetical protein